MRTVLRITAFAALLMTVIFVATSVLGQAAPSDPKAATIEAIRKHADNHVESGSPMQTQMVIDIFANNASGLSKQEIADLYEQHYLEKAKEKKTEVKLPEGLYGWLVLLASMLAAGLLGAFHKKLGEFFTFLWERIYSRVAGIRLFRRVSLGRYRESLIEEFTNVHIPFRPERPLNLFKVFVPLKLSGASNRQTKDALEAFFSSRRLMIKGPPGAGKSMLLKKVALELAEGGFRPLPNAKRRKRSGSSTVIPILLPLHRLGGSEKSINDHLVELLERNRFPKAMKFVSNALEKGWLFFLLDGLDELAEQGRPPIVQEVKDFIQRYRDCGYAVTCRSAVYQGEFDDILSDRFDILEFSDQQIWNFLQVWDKDLPPSKSIAQLVSALRDRPSIMALARNPLMLTIIAHLYCDIEDFILPQSRTEFYKQSSDILLQRWHKDFNKFNPTKKRAILQDLAMWVQEKSQTKGADRRSMDSLEAQRRVQKQLQTLGIKEDQAESIINEIVERSGLLIRIDAGRRYQFAHLTLQEFFAAEALQKDAVGLLGRFREDRTTWREVVKLWCGVGGDCTSLVNGVNEVDRLTAFECIADACQIDATLVASLIDDFKGELGDGGVSEDTLMAFGSVASAMQGRGAAVFDFLKAILENESAPERRHAAAEALAMTNLPSAAESLAATLRHSNQFSAQLARMGDLAVPALRAEAEKGNLSALDLLREIGTPLAARTLLPFLWDDDRIITVRAAWSLSAVLQLPEVETELGRIRLTEQQRRARHSGWIWAPFAEDAKPDLGVIAGRIAHLLVLGKDDIVPAPPPRVDQRIALPILAILFRNESCMTENPRLSQPNEKVTCASTLYESLEMDTRVALFQSRDSTPVRGEWETLRYMPDFSVWKSWSFWVSYACIALILFASLIAAKDVFTSFKWHSDSFQWDALSVLSIAYPAYWVIIMVLLLSTHFISKGRWANAFYSVGGNWLKGVSFTLLTTPFLILAFTEYAVACYVNHRPVRTESPFMMAIMIPLTSAGFILVVYFSSIGISYLLIFYGVSRLVSAGVFTFGVVVLAIACSQWTVYQLVRSENFFRQFAVRTQRGAAVKLKVAGFPRQQEETL